jgi:hypothetical protein
MKVSVLRTGLILGLLTLASVNPVSAQAPAKPETQRAVALDHAVLRTPAQHNFSRAPGSKQNLRLFHRTAYYTDAYGRVWSNICQTDVNWCSNGGYYLVGTPCHCGYATGYVTAE